MDYPRRLKETGFSLFELVIVVVIIAVLMGSGFGYYLKLMDDAEAAAVNLQASQFSTSISQAHIQWVLQRQPAVVEVDGSRIAMNDQGWPVGVVSEQASPDDVCSRLWSALLKARVEREGSSEALRFSARRVNNDHCRYHYEGESSLALAFTYHPLTGAVKVQY